MLWIFNNFHLNFYSCNRFSFVHCYVLRMYLQFVGLFFLSLLISNRFNIMHLAMLLISTDVVSMSCSARFSSKRETRVCGRCGQSQKQLTVILGAGEVKGQSESTPTSDVMMFDYGYRKWAEQSRSFCFICVVKACFFFNYMLCCAFGRLIFPRTDESSAWSWQRWRATTEQNSALKCIISLQTHNHVSAA